MSELCLGMSWPCPQIHPRKVGDRFYTTDLATEKIFHPDDFTFLLTINFPHDDDLSPTVLYTYFPATIDSLKCHLKTRLFLIVHLYHTNAGVSDSIMTAGTT